MPPQTPKGDNTLPFPAASGGSAPALNYRMLGVPSDLAPKKWLVHGRIGAGDVIAMYGDPGTGKSTLATDLSFAVATGVPWFGKKVQEGAVLFCALERASATERRFAALQLDRKIHNPSIALCTQQINLGAVAASNGIIGAANALANETQLATRLIVIDTFSRAAAGLDENAAGPMSVVAANLSKIASITGATVVVIHHSTKSSGELRGSSALLGAIDCAICVTKNGRDVFHANIEKSNDTAEGERFSFTLKAVELNYDQDTGEANTTVVVEPLDARQVTNNPRLRPRTGKVFEVIQALANNGSVPRLALLNTLRERGYVSDSCGSEQLRQALLDLKKSKLLNYNAKLVQLSSSIPDPPQPKPPPPLRGGE